MATRERLTAKAPAFKGQKSAYPLESYGIESAEQIQNFYLRNNQINKINGNVTYAEIYPNQAGGITSLHSFKDLVFAQRGTSLGFFFVPQNNTLTDLGITLSSTVRLFSASWRDRIVFTNSQDATMFYYPSTNKPNVAVSPGKAPTIKGFGMDPPGNDTFISWVSDGAAGNSDVQNYYMISFYDSDTNTESPCAGSCPSVNGLYELSPNGTVSPPTVFPSGGFTSAGSKKILINFAKLSAYLTTWQASFPRATHFIIYKAAGANAGAVLVGNPALYIPFYRVPNANNSNNVINKISDFIAAGVDFVDNTAYTNLIPISPPTNNSPPPTPARLLLALQTAQGTFSSPETWGLSDYSGFRHVRFFRDQMFGVGSHSFGFTVNKDVVISSNTNQKLSGVVTQFKDLLHGSEVFEPDYWPYAWEIGRGDGQETVGLGVLGDVALFIFKEGSAYYLAGSSPDSFVVRIMDLQKGCVHQGTIQETPIGVITLDRGGFVLWDKIGQGARISDDVFDVIQTIDFSKASQFYSCFDAYKNIYKCSVVVPSSQQPNYTFILDLTSMQWSYEQGTEGLSRLNFSINTNNYSQVAGFTINVGQFYDFLGSASNGRILDFSSNANLSNQGQVITAIWKSGNINFGDDQHKKQMTWIYLRAKAQVAWTIDVEVIPDYDESRKYKLTDWNVVASQSLWFSSSLAVDGSLIWDDGSGNVGGNWASAGQTRYVSKIPVKCIGYNFQIRITHRKTTDQAFAIESISAEAKALGR